MTATESELQFQHLVESLAKVADRIGTLDHAREVRQIATRGRFNLFTTLLGARDEVRLHTRYLAHLLDPKGNHDCGREFLDLFLDVVNLESLKEQTCLRVSREHGTKGFGNIDIYIEFSDAVVVIENKIDAQDQNKQIQRYSDYAKTKHKGNPHVFFLTLDEHPPSKQSLGNVPLEEVCLISYETHIQRWLETCLQCTYSFININQALQQYKSLVNQLLGNSMEANDMKDITQMLMDNSAIMTRSLQIQKALKAAESGLAKKFLINMKAELKRELREEDGWWVKCKTDMNKKYGAGVSIGHKKWNDIHFSFGSHPYFSSTSDSIWGFVAADKKALRQKLDQAFGELKNDFGDFPDSHSWAFHQMIGPKDVCNIFSNEEHYLKVSKDILQIVSRCAVDLNS